jgi:single-stranded-DNA-specific exonuclease
MAPTRWTCAPYSFRAAERVAAEVGVSPAVAAMLARRGYATGEEARRFLAADEVHDPFAFAGMEEACALVLAHVARGSPIVVHGDYDVDGVCSTAILIRALRALGAEPAWHMPNRADGYGLSAATIDRLAGRGAGLLVTVDCAITAPDEVATARERGIDVLVTDHHRPGERLPDCPILHPALSGYPFTDLCAAGVAHKLAQALRGRAGVDPEAAAADLDLVALATVADLVPLRGENRRLVREGLRALGRTSKPGLRALMRVASVDPGAVTAHSVGFRLAPRINAAGRLANAEPALELLLTEDPDRAQAVADELDLLNRERQDAETRILFAAESAQSEQAHAAGLVLVGEGWHPGVIGIVASRMVERHHRPCVLIALDGDRGRGSARSVPAYDLHAGLAACAAHLRRFGGHRAAAGLEIDRGRIDDFRRAFAAHAAASLSPHDLVAVERVDAVVPGDALGATLAEELERLAPFGQGNPAPTLLVPAARVSQVREMGEEGQHARFTLSGGGATARAVAFRTAADSLPGSPDERCDAAVRLELNQWNGMVEPRLVLRALCPTERGSCALVEPEEPYLAAFERELGSDAREASVGAAPSAQRRRLHDRRGEGFAGVAGDLVSTGERVLVVCADAARRRPAMEELIAGISAQVGDGERSEPGLVEWDTLVRRPELAAPYEHALALDPPAGAWGQDLLRGLPADAGPAYAHLAWGTSEVDFAVAVARARLDLRDEIADLYRLLRAAGPLTGDALERALRGDGSHSRPAHVAARLVRVLLELDLAELDSGTLRLAEPRRTVLERSETFRVYGDRLAEALGWLESERNRLTTRRAPAARAAVPA